LARFHTAPLVKVRCVLEAVETTNEDTPTKPFSGQISFSPVVPPTPAPVPVPMVARIPLIEVSTVVVLLFIAVTYVVIPALNLLRVILI
jgi:hypothetical protein